jgi:hypothetical protein
VLRCHHRARLRVGAGPVLGRHRLHLRDGLGTAITVGAVATLAVGAKALAKRIVLRPTGYGVVVMRGIEFAAAGFVLAFGVLLLTGYMASERMGLF